MHEKRLCNFCEKRHTHIIMGYIDTHYDTQIN